MTPAWSEQVLQDDLSQITAPDVCRPFSSREDVFDRLIPYHIFAEAEEADTQKAENNSEEIEERYRQVKRKVEEVNGRLDAEERSTRLRTASEECFVYNLLALHGRVRLSFPGSNTGPTAASEVFCLTTQKLCCLAQAFKKNKLRLKCRLWLLKLLQQFQAGHRKLRGPQGHQSQVSLAHTFRKADGFSSRLPLDQERRQGVGTRCKRLSASLGLQLRQSGLTYPTASLREDGYKLDRRQLGSPWYSLLVLRGPKGSLESLQ